MHLMSLRPVHSISQQLFFHCQNSYSFIVTTTIFITTFQAEEKIKYPKNENHILYLYIK